MEIRSVDEVLKREAQRKVEVEPLPVVEIGPSRARQVDSEVHAEIRQEIRVNSDKQVLLAELWAEISSLKTERGKLSTRTSYLVAEITEKLMNESPATAMSFMAGDLPMPEIAEHYEKIQDLTRQATEVWDKIRYVEAHGKLPEAKPKVRALSLDSPEISALLHQIRRLDDRIYKTNQKLSGKIPKNPSRGALWKQKLALDEAERLELKLKVKKLQYESRAQRSGEE